MITNEQLQSCFNENDCILRTCNSHFEQCLLLSGPLSEPLSEHHFISYGITRLSILSGFSVIHGLMHETYLRV